MSYLKALSENVLKKWGRLFVISLLVAPVAAYAQADDEEDLEELESFTVTGSRIKRIDVEPVNPVITLTAESIQDTGYLTVSDALRSLSFNSGQALTTAASNVSFTPGVQSINLRGIGNNNTLVLINGRRAAPYAGPGFDGLQQVFDLNSIPTSAIESVEILKDGASAIYGSDAVAGVVNIKLRQDYEGLNVVGQFGDMFDTGAFFRKVSATIGTTSAKTSIILSADYEAQDQVFARDLGFSDNADQTDRAHKADPEWIVDNFESTIGLFGIETLDDYLALIVGPSDPVEGGWFDNRSSRGFPGYFRLSTPVTDANGRTLSGFVTYASPTQNPTLEGAISGRNFYNYQERADLFPEYQRYSFYTRAKHDFSDSLYGILEVSFARTESLVSAAPAPADIEDSKGLDEGDPMFVPAYNFNNPFGQDIYTGRIRLLEGTDRENNVESDAPRIMAALGGTLSVADFDDWEWEIGMVYSKSSVTNASLTVSDSLLQQALMGLTRNADGSLTWDPATPIADRVYYNWFGYNEGAMIKHIAMENITQAEFEIENYDAQVAGSLFDLPAGPIGFAFGVEHREEDLKFYRTLANRTGDIVGGSTGNSTFGHRSLDSAFLEVIVPVASMLEIQVAARYESYSDEGISDEIRPKIGFKLQPFSWFLIRGSYSQAFKAPDLSYLFTPGSNSFTSSQIFDPVTQQQVDQIQIVTSGNPELSPEESDNWYVGFAVEPGGALEGFEASVDYFMFDRTNLLAQLSDFFGYQEFLSRAAEGDPTFVDLVVREPGTNQLLYIRDRYENISESKYEGFDFNLSYTLKTENLGQYRAQYGATYIDSFTIDGGEIAGNYLTPAWRQTLSLSWLFEDWRVSTYTLMIDPHTRTLGFGGGYVADESVALRYQVKTQYLTNAQVTYSGFMDMDITVGINNLFDEDPPVDPFNGEGFTSGVNIAVPQFWFVRFEKEF